MALAVPANHQSRPWVQVRVPSLSESEPHVEELYIWRSNLESTIFDVVLGQVHIGKASRTFTENLHQGYDFKIGEHALCQLEAMIGRQSWMQFAWGSTTSSVEKLLTFPPWIHKSTEHEFIQRNRCPALKTLAKIAIRANTRFPYWIVFDSSIGEGVFPGTGESYISFSSDAPSKTLRARVKSYHNVEASFHPPRSRPCWSKRRWHIFISGDP